MQSNAESALKRRLFGGVNFSNYVLTLAAEKMTDKSLDAQRALNPKVRWNNSNEIDDAELQKLYASSALCPESMYYVRGDDLGSTNDPKAEKRLKKLATMISNDLLGRA